MRAVHTPGVALFAATALVIGLTVGFGLGLWLLVARVWGVSLFGANWVALVQVHGILQLFGFVGLFAMGIALHALPRFRGAASPRAWIAWTVYGATVSGLAIRSIAQPIADIPARDALLLVGDGLLVLGTLTFSATALRVLASGRNPHRPDELVIGAGICVIPIAALLVALEAVGPASVIIDQASDDRALWTMLLGGIGTLIFGVWARLAPGFVAALPARPRPLLAGAAVWLIGVAFLAAGSTAGAWLLAAGLAITTYALSVFGAGIARQPLREHARLTRLGVRAAYGWAFVAVAILVAAALGVADSYLQVSAARHAFALGFVTLMIYAVGGRALPAFLDRALWSQSLHAWTLLVANLGVALRVVPQFVQAAEINSAVGLSGILGYVSLVLFAVNALRTVRGPAPPPAGTAVRVRFDLPVGGR